MSDSQAPLESWKEIAGYLQRDITTVRRWEKKEGLPVHRHSHEARATVYAYPSELDAWRASRRVAPEPPRLRPLWKIPAFSATILLCLIMVGNSVRPQVAVAQTQQSMRQIWAPGTAADNFGMISAAGRSLIFRDTHTLNLAARDLATGRTRLLTGAGAREFYSDDAVVSPDGRMVAYRWSRDGEYELRAVPIDGGEARTLYRGYAEPFGWTPDRSQILIMRRGAEGTNQLGFLSVKTGAVHVLKSLEWRYPVASLSPDGRYIAYSLPTGKGPARDIFLLASDGARETTVVQDPADDSFPMWSPDGSEIFFLSDRTGVNSLWSVRVAEGKAAAAAKLVRPNLGNVKPLGFTRDGALLYASQQASHNIYTAQLEAPGGHAGMVQLVSERFLGSNRGAGWSHDGKYLAYLSVRGAGNNMLVIRTVPSGEERDVPISVEPAEGTPAPVRWFPDGRSVLVVGEARPRPVFGYYRVDVNTGKSTAFLYTSSRTNFTMQPELSPDGESLYYVDSGKLRRFDLRSGVEKELKDLESANSIAVSPDGRYVAYGTSASGRPSLEIIPSAGGPSRTVFAGPFNRFLGLAWTPDQSHLLLIAEEGPAGEERAILSQVPVSGGPPESLRIPAPGTPRFPQLSPDGRMVAFESLEKSVEVWALEDFLPARR